MFSEFVTKQFYIFETDISATLFKMSSFVCL